MEKDFSGMIHFQQSCAINEEINVSKSVTQYINKRQFSLKALIFLQTDAFEIFNGKV